MSTFDNIFIIGLGITGVVFLVWGIVSIIRLIMGRKDFKYQGWATAYALGAGITFPLTALLKFGFIHL